MLTVDRKAPACEARQFERLLAQHCAPALMGVKASNLFNWRGCPALLRRLADDCGARLAGAGVGFRLFAVPRQDTLVLVYRRDCLERQLMRPGVREMLTQFGYPATEDTERLLDHLASRLVEAGGFPHEIGLFLGYPIEDVAGFCRHGGRCCKCGGPWKVYGDVRHAQRCFRRYSRCAARLGRRMEAGETLGAVLCGDGGGLVGAG
ncbi:MAG: DUF3793 family protein [Clostridia bacterium]|nr:DUF3793 family protein [Clostridia bacterium]